MKRFLKIVGARILVVPLAIAGYVAYRLTPKQLNLPLPETLVAIDTEAGRAAGIVSLRRRLPGARRTSGVQRPGSPQTAWG